MWAHASQFDPMSRIVLLQPSHAHRCSLPGGPLHISLCTRGAEALAPATAWCPPLPLRTITTTSRSAPIAVCSLRVVVESEVIVAVVIFVRSCIVDGARAAAEDALQHLHGVAAACEDGEEGGAEQQRDSRLVDKRGDAEGDRLKAVQLSIFGLHAGRLEQVDRRLEAALDTAPVQVCDAQVPEGVARAPLRRLFEELVGGRVVVSVGEQGSELDLRIFGPLERRQLEVLHRTLAVQRRRRGPQRQRRVRIEKARILLPHLDASVRREQVVQQRALRPVGLVCAQRNAHEIAHERRVVRGVLEEEERGGAVLAHAESTPREATHVDLRVRLAVLGRHGEVSEALADVLRDAAAEERQHAQVVDGVQMALPCRLPYRARRQVVRLRHSGAVEVAVAYARPRRDVVELGGASQAVDGRTVLAAPELHQPQIGVAHPVALPCRRTEPVQCSILIPRHAVRPCVVEMRHAHFARHVANVGAIVHVLDGGPIDALALAHPVRERRQVLRFRRVRLLHRMRAHSVERRCRLERRTFVQLRAGRAALAHADAVGEAVAERHLSIHRAARRRALEEHPRVRAVRIEAREIVEVAQRVRRVQEAHRRERVGLAELRGA
mmetsp:Transcript_4232/g.11163  ORF Transcript_4232/g.11163 Transcript_4232/m.11163 type:complete len:609 (-) Transcript_4232:338-2164(-)